jgi:hypothetical protein
MAFPVPICLTLMNYEQYYVQTCCTEFHPNWTAMWKDWVEFCLCPKINYGAHFAYFHIKRNSTLLCAFSEQNFIQIGRKKYKIGSVSLTVASKV